MKNLLFVCTGNYYRSRFAEYLFNDLAARYQLNWQASSRGIGVFRCNNEGPISKFTIQALKKAAIPHDPNFRMPIQIDEEDVKKAALIIGLKETEHRDFLFQEYPLYHHKFQFWHIDDVDFALPEAALQAIAEKIKLLVKDLHQHP